MGIRLRVTRVVPPYRPHYCTTTKSHTIVVVTNKQRVHPLQVRIPALKCSPSSGKHVGSVGESERFLSNRNIVFVVSWEWWPCTKLKPTCAQFRSCVTSESAQVLTHEWYTKKLEREQVRDSELKVSPLSKVISCPMCSITSWSIHCRTT